MEVTGQPMLFDPPSFPGCDGPFVMRDTTTGRTYAAVAIALQGYFELEFTRVHPPKAVDTYFTVTVSAIHLARCVHFQGSG